MSRARDRQPDGKVGDDDGDEEPDLEDAEEEAIAASNRLPYVEETPAERRVFDVN